MQTLGLIIADHGVKPAVVMKALLTTFTLVGLAAAAIIAVASCSVPHVVPYNQNLEMFLGDPNAKPPKRKLKSGDEGKLRAAWQRSKDTTVSVKSPFWIMPKGPRTLITVKTSMCT